jgi:hypothetical protein
MDSLIVSALLQVVLFSFIPFVWWLVAGRKENFFKWIGLKKPNLEVSLVRLCITTMVVAGIYIAAMVFLSLWQLAMRLY